VIARIRIVLSRMRANAKLIYAALTDPLKDRPTAQDGPAVWLPPVGATIDWSPAAEVAQAAEHELEDEARLELAAAEAELKPLLDDFHKRMAKAFRSFDAGLLAPMHTTARWHAAGRDCCQRCAQHRAQTFGAIGERFGIRSFRLDTDTAEYKIYNPSPTPDLVAA
jgi:hypothetical protein